jgi:hypothetical protein
MEFTAWHIGVLCLWGAAVVSSATAYAITRDRRVLLVLLALALPPIGVLWAMTLFARSGDQAEPADALPTKPPEYLDEMADSIPDDHPDVTPERRERAEQGASAAIEFDDASRAERERIDAELEAELRDLLDD